MSNRTRCLSPDNSTHGTQAWAWGNDVPDEPDAECANDDCGLDIYTDDCVRFDGRSFCSRACAKAWEDRQ